MQLSRDELVGRFLAADLSIALFQKLPELS